MTAPIRQRGAALLIGVFLIVVIALVGTMIALTSTTQQITSGRNLEATGAYYAARARLEREIDNAADSPTGTSDCGVTNEGNTVAIDGFTTNLTNCAHERVDEGGPTYDVFTLDAVAFKGSRSSGTLVRRKVQAVVSNVN